MQLLLPYGTLAWRGGMEHGIVGSELVCRRGRSAYDGDDKTGGMPIRLHHGSSDDYLNPAACWTLVSRLKPVGVDSALTEYADSQHGFDSPTSPFLLAVPKVQSTRHCGLKEGPNGTLADADTGQPYELKAAFCVAIGAPVGHNAQATEAVRADVTAFLTATLLKWLK